MKKLKIQMNGHSDEFGTPFEAIIPLIPYLNKDWLIYEAAFGKGTLADNLTKAGFKVTGEPNLDFLEDNDLVYDVIVTNPPYSKKYEFLKRCYEIGKPFALLMPISALEGKKRGELYGKYGIQLIIPNKRINFITPSGKGGGSWFQVAWFCYKLNLPKEINFVELGE